MQGLPDAYTTSLRTDKFASKSLNGSPCRRLQIESALILQCEERGYKEATHHKWLPTFLVGTVEEFPDLLSQWCNRGKPDAHACTSTSSQDMGCTLQVLAAADLDR